MFHPLISDSHFQSDAFDISFQSNRGNVPFPHSDDRLPFRRAGNTAGRQKKRCRRQGIEKPFQNKCHRVRSNILLISTRQNKWAKTMLKSIRIAVIKEIASIIFLFSKFFNERKSLKIKNIGLGSFPQNNKIISSHSHIAHPEMAIFHNLCACPVECEAYSSRVR